MGLRPYQAATIRNMHDRAGALIAHDLGCGKSLTAIGLDYVRRQRLASGKLKTLIICPLSVMSHWKNEYAKWCPELKVLICDNKNRAPFIKEALNPNTKYNVFIIHYAGVRLEVDNLRKVSWFHVVVDEAHALQNRKASQTKAIKELDAAYRTGLTGTPIHHKPDGLWSLLNFLYPKVWTSYWRFFHKYMIWVDWTGYKEIIGVQNEEDLLENIGPYYSRIQKEDVFPDLPDVYETAIYVKLEAKQKKAYKQMESDMLAWVGEHEHEPINAPVALAQITRLRQFASAYAEIQRREVNGELIEQVKLSEPSTKLDAVMDIIQNTDQQVVVFSSFSQLINLLAARLDKAKITYGKIIGGVSQEEREASIADFQAGKRQVFLGTIKAGGEGIELTAASTLIFLDREWAPSRNKQAIGRLHRPGQKNAVQVIDIIAEGTLDVERNEGIALSWNMVRKMLGELKK